MRINKFRNRVFQPVPTSISNKCDSTPHLSFSNKRNIQNCRNKFWISQQPLEKIISSALQSTPQKTSNKVSSMGFLKVLQSWGISTQHQKQKQGRSGLTLTQAWHQSHQPTQKMPVQTSPPLGAGTSMWQCQEVLRMVGYWGSELQEQGKIKTEAGLARPPIWEWHHKITASVPLQLCTTKKGVTVIDSSKHTQTLPRIPKNLLSNNAKRKTRTREMDNKKEALGVPVLERTVLRLH